LSLAERLKQKQARINERKMLTKDRAANFKSGCE
jgi:hypothetical protein